MDMDIVQLRWQGLRAFETSQAHETENFELRSQVLALKVLLKETDIKNKQALSALGRSVKRWISGTRADMHDLRDQSLRDIRDAAAMKDTLASALQQMELKGATHDSTIQFLQNERKKLLGCLEESQQETVVANKAMLSEADRNRVQIEKLRAELGESDSQRAELMQQCDEHVSQHAMQQQKYDGLYRQCDGLLQTIKRLEQENAATVADFREAEARLLYDQSAQLASHQLETEKNMHTIAQLEQQIERLTAALMGNKSHFRKFVELKAENVSLHSELKTIASKSVAHTLLLVPPEGPHTHGSHGKSGQRRDTSPSGRSIDGGGSTATYQAGSIAGSQSQTTASGRYGREDGGGRGGDSSVVDKRGRGRELLVGSKLTINRGRGGNGNNKRMSHSPIRDGRDDGDSVISQISGASHYSSNVGNLRVSLPVPHETTDFLPLSDETPRDFISADGMIGRGLLRAGISGRAFVGTPPSRGALPGTREGSENTSSLPLSVPLMSKTTREGLVHRHVAV